MRIVMVYRYFWPDTPPYATMLKDISGWLAKAGHTVEIITAQPAYKKSAGVPKQPKRELIDGVTIVRVPLLDERDSAVLKVINGGLFIAQAFLRLTFGRNYDLAWTATMPPVLQALAVLLAARFRRAKFVYHIQDIYPEIKVANANSRMGVLAKLIRSVDNFTLRRSDVVVVLSEDMRRSFASRGVPVDNVKIIQNFALRLAGSIGTALASPPSQTGEVKFVFAGNIGRFQNLEALVDAFAHVQNRDVKLILVGDGRAKAALQKRVADSGVTNVEFKDHMSAEAAFNLMCDCHIGLVSLNPGLYKYAFPSKALTYMAANLPMLAMVENESRLAKMISEEGIGVSVDWNVGKAALSEAILLTAEKARTGTMKPVESRGCYHPDIARKNWIDLIASLEQNFGGTK